jgi:putative mycofactocin binding protein MftB
MSRSTGCAASISAVEQLPTHSEDLSGPWRLDPQVRLRPEAFGALAYHFGTRRLSFLKSPQLCAVVEGLDAHSDPVSACRAVGVSEEELPGYRRALGVLAKNGMIVPRGADR